jgi:uncharacterized phage protein gp47/JayE
MTAGLSSTGFEAKTLADILADIETRERATIDPTLDTSAESVVGNLNAVMATKLRELWELAAIVYAARAPRNASLEALDALSAITGTTRKGATKGTVTLSLTILHGATVPAGSVVHVAGDVANRWVTLDAVTNTLGSVGSYAALTVDAEAESAGHVLAYAHTITEIATPVSGWAFADNVLDATPGRDVETDAALRLRREREVQGAGAGTVGAITAALSAVASVRQVVVFENPTDTTDADGLPPHSIEALVLGGSDTLIRTALWATKPAGIRTHGSTTGTTLDADGVARSVAFTRPTEVSVYLTLVVAVRRDTYAGGAAVKAAALAVGEVLLAGDTVRLSTLIRAVMGVAGVVDVVALCGLASGSVFPFNLAMTRRQLASFDSARITVVETIA